MKRIIVTIIFLTTVNSILAQTYNMKIKQGTDSTYSLTSTVDEITFINTTTTPFVCGDVILYGGETYPTVSIGTQCWFQRNLNIGKRINSSQNQTDNDLIEKYCFNDDAANCTTYGGLYQWGEAMQYVTAVDAQGICPEGWHIPTYEDCQTLRNEVSQNGNVLKAVGQGIGSGVGTNTRGFSALPSGFLDDNGNFNNFLEYYTDLWTTEPLGSNASSLYLYYTNNGMSIGNDDKEFGFSVRCVKD
jgi:uncharacterized protein (TIGR02145 family)